MGHQSGCPSRAACRLPYFPVSPASQRDCCAERIVAAMIRDTIAQVVARSVAALHERGALPDVELPPIEVMRPQIATHGDYATNIAMKLAQAARGAGAAKTNPRALAEAITEQIRETADLVPAYDLIASVEVAGPGFINLRLKPSWLLAQAGRVVASGNSHGAGDLGR